MKNRSIFILKESYKALEKENGELKELLSRVKYSLYSGASSNGMEIHMIPETYLRHLIDEKLK